MFVLCLMASIKQKLTYKVNQAKTKNSKIQNSKENINELNVN